MILPLFGSSFRSHPLRPMLRSLLIVGWLLLSLATKGQRVMWWNVENLFDCHNDSLHRDEEFLPEGNHHWTPNRYWHKLDNITRTIAAISQEPSASSATSFASEGWPALIGLCEVENDSCLYDLVRRTALRVVGYEYVITEGVDERGVEVAVLYLPELFRLEGCEGIRVPSEQEGLRATRDILHVWGRRAKGDLLDIYALHFPSRAGGGREGNRNRLLAARTLSSAIDRARGKKVLVMGDFNAEPDDPIFREILRKNSPASPLSTLNSELSTQNSQLTTVPCRSSASPDSLVSLNSPLPTDSDLSTLNSALSTSSALSTLNSDPSPTELHLLTPQKKRERRKAKGTYYFEGQWGYLDHILVSSELLPEVRTQAQVGTYSFLLDEKGVPWRTYQGPIYKGGYSDHLPLWMELQSSY